jgi:hypothetical protein
MALSIYIVLFLLRGAQGHSLRGMVAHPKCVHLGWAPDLVRGLGPEAAKSTVSFWRKAGVTSSNLVDTFAGLNLSPIFLCESVKW